MLFALPEIANKQLHELAKLKFYISLLAPKRVKARPLIHRWNRS